MPDAATLASLGGAALGSLWLPVAAWTVLALIIEGALRLTRAEAAVGLPVRGAALAALPVALAVPAALGAWAPNVPVALAAFAPPAVTWLPEVVVGGGAAAPALVAPPAGLIALGVLTALALAASVVALVRVAGGALRLARVRRALPPAPPAVAAALDAARQRAGVGRPVAAVEAPPGAAPFTVGWRRPVVAVPADLGGAALDVALAHELAHVRRADFAWHAAQRAVAAAFVWHPLAQALGRGLDLDRERAADAAVLAACPGRRRTYADLLLRYASLPAPPLALGAGRGDSSLKTRIDAMTCTLSPDRARRLARRGRLAGLLTLVLAGGLAAMTAPHPAPPDPAGDRALAPPDTTDEVYEVADVQPQLIGGLEGLQERLDYPELQHQAGVEGTAVLQFIVSKEGAVTDLQLLRSTGNDGLDQAAAEAVREARFEPGMQDGQPVRVRFAVPVTFQLEGGAATPPVPEAGADGVYNVAEVQPELVGGLEALQERVVYPEDARAEGVEGQVVVQFVVTEAGGVADPAVLRSPDDRLSAAALDAVRGLRFEPGRQGGEAVPVRFAVPITFRLPAGEDQGMAPGEVRYWGVDVSRLSGGAEIERRIRSLPSTLAQENAAGGTAEVRYTIGADGVPYDIDVVSGGGPLLDAALAIVRAPAFHTAEGARPGLGGTWTGTFGLNYQRPG
ncbi:M56 family metallopeptidase [Rubrivirga sp. S365]|uniref:M56 family metallopeptidase n=1 Tax=Rubrivirga litoralis TaxID=3075598 RepID=A0ABU3BU39_9BACT|nr:MULTISPECIES: M56 family metallopeptidase [unclassified Rubrivirga]MDT0632802.1 M56 family metallopeptidase [Rubrivirga sp. F394]MDT7857493.1 M56 family metallopeptidase [Rubrivirga sp. S365]